MDKIREMLTLILVPFLYTVLLILLCYILLILQKENVKNASESWMRIFKMDKTDTIAQTSDAASDLKNAIQQAQETRTKKQLAAQEAAKQQEVQQQQIIESLSPPEEGKHYADIIIESLGMNVPLYYGDSNAILRKGAGQYTGSSLPGKGSQILVAAHNTNYFKPLQNITNGTIIRLATSYGEFQYQVVDIKIANATDTSTYNLSLNYEQLVLYTCYPFTGPPGKTQRFFVYANRIG